MSSSCFIFEGFLPKKKIERERILLQISKREITTIIFEFHICLKTFKRIKRILWRRKGNSHFKELTKIYEENINNSIDEVMNEFENKEILGEITIVIKGCKEETSKINKIYLKEELHELVKAGLSLTVASNILQKNNIAKRIIYNLY